MNESNQNITAENITSGSVSRFRGAEAFGDRLFFSADSELWVTDGTVEGTEALTNVESDGIYLPLSLTASTNQLYFTADDDGGIANRELWVTDGTTTGTRLVADVRAGERGSYPGSLTDVNGLLYFSADDGAVGRELWVSDGSTEGTRLIADVNPGTTIPGAGTESFSSNPSAFTALGDKVFFEARSSEGNGIWSTDGTAAGTELAIDASVNSVDLVEFNDKLYFVGGINGDGGANRGLLASDGTTAGTEVIADFTLNRNTNRSYDLTEFNDKLYFIADDGVNGSELWVTDGSTEGTQLLADINPGSDSSYARSLTEFNDKLYFIANDGVNGSELWVTDGSTDGTQLALDLNPGAADSTPQGFGLVDSDILSATDDGLFQIANIGEGNDLFKLTFDDDSSNSEDEFLTGTDEAETLEGGDGNDTLRGGNGQDFLAGQNGDDFLLGEAERDFISGGGGNDTLVGAGRAIVDSSSVLTGISLAEDDISTDNLTGGSGADLFIVGTEAGSFYTNSGDLDHAIITDFNSGEDRIQLAGAPEDYVTNTSFFGTSLFIDRDGDGTVTENDEFIASIQRNDSLSLDSADFEFV